MRRVLSTRRRRALGVLLPVLAQAGSGGATCRLLALDHVRQAKPSKLMVRTTPRESREQALRGKPSGGAVQ